VSKYISPSNNSPSENIELADEVLRALYDVCKERGVFFFLSSGTCLGLYRDGTWTEDNDIDVVLVCGEEDFQGVWKELAELPGWDWTHGLRKGKMQLDLQRTAPDLPYIVPGWKPNPFTFECFDAFEYNGMELLAPSPVEKYLAWEFSELWRIPMTREEWISITDWMQGRIDGRHYA